MVGVLKFEVDPASKTTLLSPTQIAKELLILSKLIVIQKVVVSKGRLFNVLHCNILINGFYRRILIRRSLNSVHMINYAE